MISLSSYRRGFPCWAFGRAGFPSKAALSRLVINRYCWFFPNHSKLAAEISKVRDEIDKLVELGIREDAHAYSTLLLKCGNYKLLAEGRRLHAVINDAWKGHPERLLLNCLVEMYGKCGRLEQARQAFWEIKKPNVFSWTIVIAAHAANGDYREALGLFRKMNLEGVKPNSVTYVNTIGACAGLQDLPECRKLHQRILEEGFDSCLVVRTALVTMYGRCNRLDYAEVAFQEIRDKDMAAWNALLAAYAQKGWYEECLGVYSRMETAGLKPDEVTFVCVIDACAGVGDLERGRSVHERLVKDGYERDCLLSALVDMYGKCGSPEESKQVFNKMKWRETSTWNALISAYAQQGHTSSTCSLLQLMDQEGIKATDLTYTSLLGGFSGNGSLRAGKRLHARIAACGLESDLMVATSLISMYGKCGVAEDARQVFDRLEKKTQVFFNAMIGVYAELGHAKQALETYWTMDQVGLYPDSVTLLSVLFSCSHAGLLEEGLSNFRSMLVDRGIRAELDHYRCLVDLLARAGWLSEAEALIDSKFAEEDDLPSRLSLLSACLIQGSDPQLRS